MEEMIRKYEKFITRETQGKSLNEKSEAQRERLVRMHEDMVKNFQHERLVHLLIMLFFIFITVGLLFTTIVLMLSEVDIKELLYALYILDGLMTVLSVAYVKHYYFLENHIQGLYKYYKILLRLEGRSKEE